MHFCSNCENMYYIRLDAEDSNKLIHYCRKCGNEDQTFTSENVCISKTELIQSEQGFSHIINKYTKLDPTLPRINTILCPNANCETNKGKEKEIIYIRYNEKDMKYVYLCSTCNHVWKP